MTASAYSFTKRPHFTGNTRYEVTRKADGVLLGTVRRENDATTWIATRGVRTVEQGLRSRRDAIAELEADYASRQAEKVGRQDKTCLAAATAAQSAYDAARTVGASDRDATQAALDAAIASAKDDVRNTREEIDGAQHYAMEGLVRNTASPAAATEKTASVAVPAGLIAALAEADSPSLAEGNGLLLDDKGRQVHITGAPEALCAFGDYLYTIAALRQDGIYTSEDYPYSATQLRKIADRFPNVRNDV